MRSTPRPDWQLARRPAQPAEPDRRLAGAAGLTLDATLLVTGPQADIGRESGIAEKIGGYTVLNLAASYRLTDTWSLVRPD